MSKISGVRYMRDYYPPDMNLRNHIESAWRRASVRAGFQEWDAPIMEQLDLYRRKSGDEIVGQLYNLTTKGGEQLAIRPEMTPSLARMIVAQQNALPRPIKWFCIARMCRYERGQRGRLREFFQWNADILGVDDATADAEVISVALDGLLELGLTADDVEVRLNSRKLLSDLLTALGVSEPDHARVFTVADKKAKATDAELTKLYQELPLPAEVITSVRELLELSTLDDVKRFAEARQLSCDQSFAQLDDLLRYLKALGKESMCRFDMSIVRGLAYYTGPVFEIFDKQATLRAVAGGGRYDKLLEVMGGQPMSACGFGMGDVVLGELLSDLKRLPVYQTGSDVLVVAIDEANLPDAIHVTGQLRAAQRSSDKSRISPAAFSIEFSRKAGGLGKQFKKASDTGVKAVVLVGGDEWKRGAVKVKLLATGHEQEISYDAVPEVLTLLVQ